MENPKNPVPENQIIKSKRRIPPGKWFRVALQVFPLLIVGIYFSVWLTEAGLVSESSFWPGMILLFLGALAYFHLLRSYLRWYHMIRFQVESFFICLFTGLIFEGQSAVAEEMTISILASSMLFPFIIWIPFVMISTRRRLNPEQDEPPSL